jgi:hypothetical protein
LGAEIGLAIVSTLGAVGVFALGFVRLVQGAGNRAKGIAYLASGVALIGASAAIWGWSGG